MATTMTYGAYDFRTNAGPIPFISLDKQMKLNGAGTSIGSVYQLTLNGTLTPLPSGTTGYTQIDAMQDALLSAFSSGGQNFVVSCDSNQLMSVYPRVNRISINPSDDNWVQTAPYTIELEFDGAAISGSVYVDEVDENWTVQVDESTSVYDWTLGATGDRGSTVINVSHELSAKGVSHYDSGGLVKPAWQQARDWVVSQLGISSSDFSSNNVLNLNPSKFGLFNHARIEQRNEQGGTFNVSETWLGLDTSVAGIAGSGIEEFTASVRQELETGLTIVDVNGSVRGLEARNMVGATGSYAVTTTKYANASGCWNTIRPKLINRAQIAAGTVGSSGINPQPINLSVAHSPPQGSISYSYTYDTRPCNIITGAIFENINIVNIYPTDVFARIPILGRSHGPLLQAINTITESHRVVNIDIVVPITGGCTLGAMLANSPKTQVDTFLCQVQEDLDNGNTTIFLTSDQDSWNPKTGRYSRNVDWVYTSCGGSAPSTDFC